MMLFHLDSSLPFPHVTEKSSNWEFLYSWITIQLFSRIYLPFNQYSLYIIPVLQMRKQREKLIVIIGRGSEVGYPTSVASFTYQGCSRDKGRGRGFHSVQRQQAEVAWEAVSEEWRGLLGLDLILSVFWVFIFLWPVG